MDPVFIPFGGPPGQASVGGPGPPPGAPPKSGAAQDVEGVNPWARGFDPWTGPGLNIGAFTVDSGGPPMGFYLGILTKWPPP